MPDSARLVAALCLAGVGFVLSGLIVPLFPDSTDFGYFTLINIGIGLVVGWVSMGKRAGRGITSAINNGLTGVALLIFWGLFVQSANEMVRLALRNRFDGPFEAILAIFEIGYEWALVIATLPVAIAALTGAVIAGVLTEYAWRTWR